MSQLLIQLRKRNCRVGRGMLVRCIATKKQLANQLDQPADQMSLQPAHRRGFTLIEITIAAALLALFLVIALGSITNLTNLFQQTQAVQNNQQAALLMIEAIKREAAFAASVQAVPVPPAPVNDAEPNLNGLCINRNGNGQVLFFLAADPTNTKYDNVTNSGKYNNPNGYARQQENDFYGVGNSPAYPTPGPDFFSVKHLYRSDNCSIHDPANTAHVSKVGGNGGNGGLINNTNVQFFSVQTVWTSHDQSTLSYAIGLEVTQVGPPGIVINASNPGKQFDDTVVMRTVIYPNVLP